MSGAASQRPSLIFSPHWPKMTKWRPGLAAEYCSSSQVPFSSNLISMAKPPRASMTLAATMLASVKIGSRLMVTSTGSERSTEMFWLVPAGSGLTSICTRKAAVCCFFAGLAAASQSQQECQRQIDVESSRQNFHSGPHKTATREQSKDTYGQTIQQS